MNYRTTAISLVFGCLLACLGTSCASFAGHEIPTVSADQIRIREPKPSADFDVSFRGPMGTSSRAAKLYQDEIEKVISQSRVFDRFKAAESGEKYHLTFDVQNKGDMGLAVLSGYISGLTLTIIPGFARDNYVMTVTVKRGSEELKTYEYRDHFDTWIQLFLVFLTPWHTPGKVRQQVTENMVLTFLRDVQQDGILK